MARNRRNIRNSHSRRSRRRQQRLSRGRRRRWRRTWCRRATGKKPHIVVDSWPRAAVARVARSNSLTEEEEEKQAGRKVPLGAGRTTKRFGFSFGLRYQLHCDDACGAASAIFFFSFSNFVFFFFAFHTRPNQNGEFVLPIMQSKLARASTSLQNC